jgi:hypothetical protein
MIVTIREVYCHLSEIAQNGVRRTLPVDAPRSRLADTTDIDVVLHAEHAASVGACVWARGGRQNGARSRQNRIYLSRQLGKNTHAHTSTPAPDTGTLLQAPSGATTQSLRLRPATVTHPVQYTTTRTGITTVSVHYYRYCTYHTRDIQPVLSLYTNTHYSDPPVHCAGSASYKLQHTLDPARRTHHPTRILASLYPRVWQSGQRVVGEARTLPIH